MTDLFHYSIPACLSLPVSGEKNPRHLSDTKSVKTIWPVPRYHFVNDISEGNPKLIHDVRLEDTGALQYAKGLAVIRR